MDEQTFTSVDPDVKVNGQYYREILLTRDLLPDIKQYSDYFTFQQDVAQAHRARETVELLKVETPDFIYTKNIYKICNCKPHLLTANFRTNTMMYNLHSNQSTFEKGIAKIQMGPDFMKHDVH